MIVTLDEKRRLTIPVALAPAAPGDAFDARFDEEDLPPRSREYPKKPKLWAGSSTRMS
ncbi:MAG TPA: hypothetical protein VGQ78_00940 [Vicinamibacteria bacterium]|nr:hypothetical protein [Vicinamibacteria bacterium]